MRKELYNLLYEWFVCEYDCSHCEHIKTFVDGDARHPCNKCNYCEKFKLAKNINADLKSKVNEIINIVKEKE